MSTTGTGTAVTLTGQASWSIDASTDRIEVTSFGDTNKTYVQGLPDISGDFSGFFDDSDATLFTAAASGDGTKMYLYPDFTNAPLRYWYGPAWVDYSVGAAVAEAVTLSGTFGANGAWGRQ